MNYTKPEIIQVPHFNDERGALGVIETSKITGFDIKRVYYLYGSSSKGSSRGFHAHKELKQLILCVNGECNIKLEDKYGAYSFNLNKATHGLIVPPGTWRELELSHDAFVIVFSSADYSEEDYIRDYNQFKNWLAKLSVVNSVPYIVLDRCHEQLYLEINKSITEVIDKGNFIGGDVVKKFENTFAKECNVSHAIGCGNGLDALMLILHALNIGPGDEVIVPVNSFIATALAVERVGAKSVFVDCNQYNYSLDVDSIEQLINPKTKAIIPVHLYGIPAPMDKVKAIADKYGLYVIEDAAQAHGSQYHGEKIGSFSDAAAFSFYPTKNLGAMGDAGAVVTNNAELANKIRLLGNYGSTKKYFHDCLGFNSRLDPIQAAVLMTKLPHLEAWNIRRRDLAKKYFDGLSNLPQIRLVEKYNLDDVEIVWHVFPIRVLGNRNRETLIEYLEQKNIGYNIHYPRTITQQPPYSNYAGNFPNAETIAQEIISLPLDPFHTDNEIEYVISNIKQFYEKS